MVDAGLKRTTFEEVQMDMRRKVAKAVWGPSSMLPGRRELAKEYGVSTVTIGRAIDALIADGILRADGRRGTFVVPGQTGASPSEPVRAVTVGIVGTLYPAINGHLPLNNLWVRELVQTIEHQFSDADHESVFTNLYRKHGLMTPLTEGLAQALSDNVDGVIVLAADHSPQTLDAAAEIASQSDIPVVFITSAAMSRPFPHVFSDGFDAGYQAASHLIRQGAETCTFLSPFKAWWTEERLSGAQAAWSHAGLNPSAVREAMPEAAPWNHVIDIVEPVAAGYRAAKEAHLHGLLTGGVICANDEIAVGMIHAATDLGLQPGKDFLLIGFDDSPDSRDQGLSTFRVSQPATGREACRLLIDSIHRRNESLQVRLRWRLIPRASTRWQLS